MSNGARFIWNTQYFHVAKPGESSTKYAKSATEVVNLVEYCASREGVALRIADEHLNDPPTQKQESLIRELEKAFSEQRIDYKESFEYRDYTEFSSKGTASEYISYLSERLRFSGAASQEYTANLIEYAAKRPGAQMIQSHGLFSSEETVDLELIKDRVSSHEGNIWTHIVSLRREDAHMLGYESAEPWRDLVMSKLDVLAKAHNIKIENLEWYAAMHNESHHPHIHLFIMSKDPNEGFFSEKKYQSITRCKSAFANDIFADEMYNEYVLKDDVFNEIKSGMDYELKSLLDNPLSGYSDDDKQFIINRMMDLSTSLRGSNTKYGYLKPDLKKRVNEILRHIVYDNDHLSNLYKQWCEHQFSIEKIYITDPNSVPIDEQGEKFNLFRNMIIRQCCEISSIQSELSEKNSMDYYTKSFDPDSKQFKTNNRQIDDFEMIRSKAEDINLRDAFSVRKLADYYLYDPSYEDVDMAVMWYGIAADQLDDGLSAYKLGQIYLYGLSGYEKNTELGNDYCRQAYYSFKWSIKNFDYFDKLEHGNIDQINPSSVYDDVSRSEAYKEFLIGKMYLKGEGIPQNYTNSMYSFLLAAHNGYKTANYYIGNQFYYGLGVEQDYKEAFHHYQKAENAYGFYRMASMYMKGEGVDLDLIKAEDCLLRCRSKVAAASFELARLYESNRDIFQKGNEEIFDLYKDSLIQMIDQEKKYQDSFTEMRIAGLYLEGKGTDVDVDKAIDWLKKSSLHDNPDAYYQLGYMYSSDKYSLNNTKLSQEYYQKALEGYLGQEKENSNANAEYRIARMYQNGLTGDRINMDKAIYWLEQAAIHNHSAAAYQLAKIYEKGQYVLRDMDTARKYYQLSSDHGNSFASFKLGSMYLEEGNIEKAVSYLKQAAEGDVSYADYKLGQIYSSETYGVSNAEQAQSHYAKAIKGFEKDFSEHEDGFIAYRIGYMYQKGIGTDIDIQKSIEWYSKAADIGSPDAMYQLGYIYRDSSSPYYNPSLSQKYFSDSLRLYLNNHHEDPNDGYTALRIGRFYHYGLGVERDIDKAIEYYTKAKELGYSVSMDKVNELQEEQSLAMMSIATTAAHLGRMFQNDTVAKAQSRIHHSDKKILRQEKKLKVEAGQAIDDYSQE